MKPFLVTPDMVESYLEAGHWTRETMLDRYAAYASEFPDRIACCDAKESLSWADLDSVSDRMAVRLIDLGIDRDARALVRIPSGCREIVLRVAFKKAGIIGVFTPLQWRRRELDYVMERVDPALIVVSGEDVEEDVFAWLTGVSGRCHLVDTGNAPAESLIGWEELLDRSPDRRAGTELAGRPFRFDEISLITASSGTSGFAKLCEWPEGAQICQSRVLADRMEITGADRIGIFAPTSGAAGLMMWMVSWTVPCTCYFPAGYRAPSLLDLVEEAGITVATTVPVILVRLTEEPLESRDLQSLRLIRIGTAAADMSAARSFEERSGCRVVVASGSMECTGFGHAHVNEPAELRLDGSVGRPLDGCRLRIVDDHGNSVPAGTAGELRVTAPFSSSGYWKDPEGTAAVWSDGWYSTGDVGVLDESGRLTLQGRLKETINRSGHKILPGEIERELSQLPGVVECSVVGAPDREYGQVPWAFLQMRPDHAFDIDEFRQCLEGGGLASYKIPARFIEVTGFPRVNDNKVDKKALLQSALSGAA